MSALPGGTPIITPPDHLTLASATHLLGLGLDDGQRPVNELIARLESGAAPDWLEKTLDQGLFEKAGAAREMLLEGRASVEEIRAVKERSKRMLKAAKSAPERQAALAGYFLSIAAAIVNFRNVPSDRPLGDIREVLIDLATAAPEPWSEMLGKATIVLEELIDAAG